MMGVRYAKYQRYITLVTQFFFKQPHNALHISFSSSNISRFARMIRFLTGLYKNTPLVSAVLSGQAPLDPSHWSELSAIYYSPAAASTQI